MRKGWTYRKLAEVASFVNDGDWIESRHQADDGIRLIQTGNIGNGFFKAKEDKPHFISEQTFNDLGCTEIFPGDCLVSRLPDPVGRACLIPDIGSRMITAVDCTIIRFKDVMLPEFFVYYSRSKQYERSIGNSTTGTTRKRISRKNLESILVPTPFFPEQERIVAELDLLQGIIDKQKAQLKELDTLAQSIFYDMFGDPVENERGWTVYQLIELVTEDCHISYGIVQPGDGEKIGVPVVRPVDLTTTFVHNNGLKLTTEAISNAYKRTILKGDELLLCVRGTTGIVSLAAEDLIGCNVSRGITPLRFKTANRFFMLYQFKTPMIQRIVSELTHGIALKGMNMSDVRKMRFICPPSSLQDLFGKKIESIERQKASINASIAETQKLFDYTMDKYFG